MTRYLCVREFLGSTDGARVTRYLAGVEYYHAEFGDELAQTALNEGWINELADTSTDKNTVKRKRNK